MGVVEAAEARGLLGERHQLLGRGVRPGRVVQPGGEAPGALLHRLAHHGRMSATSAVVGGPVVPAHAPDAHRGVAQDEATLTAVAVVVAEQLGHGEPLGRQGG